MCAEIYTLVFMTHPNRFTHIEENFMRFVDIYVFITSTDKVSVSLF